MSELTGVVVVAAWILSAIVGAIIGVQTGKAGKGALLGFFFGPLGWIMMMCDIGAFGLSVTILIGAMIATFGIAKALRQDREFAAKQRRKEQVAAAESAQREQESVRRDEQARIDAAPAPTSPQNPGFDRYGRPNYPGAVTPVPITPRPTPDPRAVASEIARKYAR